MTTENLNMTSLHREDGPWTVVLLDLHGYQGVGCAKRHPDDEHDPNVGAALASSRALADLAREIHAAAMDRVRGA